MTVKLIDDTKQTDVLGQGRFLRLVRRRGWEFTERMNASGVVVMVPITDVGEIVLVEQERIPVSSRVIELPAGLVGDEPGAAGEDLMEAARRELIEETGFEAKRFEYLLTGPSSVGSSREILQIYLATGLVRVGPGGGVPGESIVVHVVPLAELDGWITSKIAEGMMVDPKMFGGIYLARRKLGM